MPWQRGQRIDYYISAAWGYAFNADKGKVSVGYANEGVRAKRGKLISWTSNPTAGAEVFVPAKGPSATGTDAVPQFGAVAQILAGSVAIVLAVVRS